MTRIQSRPHRLEFTDIEAWERVNGVRLDAWQVAAITLLDDRFIDVANSPLPILPPKQGQDDGGKALVEAFKRHVAKRKKKR